MLFSNMFLHFLATNCKVLKAKMSTWFSSQTS